jgi:RNA recognition motif-containing protein
MAMKTTENTYSSKVFVGGFPFTCSNDDLIKAFSAFGPFTISWPNHRGLRPKNYAFLIFESNDSVKRFVDAFPAGTKNFFVNFMVGMRSARVSLSTTL